MHGEGSRKTLQAIARPADRVQLLRQQRHGQVALRLADVVLAGPRSGHAADVGTARRRTAEAAVVVLAALQREGRVTVVGFLVGQRQGGLEILAGRQKQLARQVHGLLIADFFVRDRIDVFASVLAIAGGHAEIGLVGDQWTACPGAQVVRFVLGGAQRNLAGELVGRASGDIVDGAGVGAPAVLRRLRALDDFHALDVGQVNRRHQPAHVHAIHEGGNGLYVGDAVHDGGLAAHRGAIDAGVAPEAGLKRKARRIEGDVIHAQEAQLADVVGREGADRDGYVLNGLLALARGNDDLFQRALLRYHGTRGNDHARNEYGKNGKSESHLGVLPVGLPSRQPVNYAQERCNTKPASGRDALLPGVEGGTLRGQCPHSRQSCGSPGMRAVMQAPLPGGLATSTSPPCASAITRHR